MSPRRHDCPCKNPECNICCQLFWFRPSMLTPNMEIQARMRTIPMATDATACEPVEPLQDDREQRDPEIPVDVEPDNGTLKVAPTNKGTRDCRLMDEMKTSFSNNCCPNKENPGIDIQAGKHNLKVRKSRLRRKLQSLLQTPPRNSTQFLRCTRKLVNWGKLYWIKQKLTMRKRTKTQCVQCSMIFKLRSALISHKVRCRRRGSVGANNFSPTTACPTKPNNESLGFPIEATEDTTHATDHAVTGAEPRSLPNDSPLLSIEEERGVWDELGLDTIDFAFEGAVSPVQSLECYTEESQEIESAPPGDIHTIKDNHLSSSLDISNPRIGDGIQEDGFTRPISQECDPPTSIESDNDSSPSKISECNKQNRLSSRNTDHSGEPKIVRIKIKMTGVVVEAFKCSVCDKLFTEKGNAARHVRSHTGGKLFECSQCDKQFLRKDSLKRHLKSHNAVKCVKCNHCDAMFTTEGHRRRHFLSFHLGKDSDSSDNKAAFECGICSKSYKFEVRLRRHIDTVHARVKSNPPGPKK